jgi:iron(III) transport system permease protein
VIAEREPTRIALPAFGRPRVGRALRRRRARGAPALLIAAAALVCALAAVPLGYIVARALDAPPSVWANLWAGQIPRLLQNTIWLVGTTVAFATLLGVSLACLVERTDLPGRRWWRWVLALPLAVPAYVAAAAAAILLRRGGLAEQAYTALTGAPRGTLPLPDIFSLGGATVVIGLCVYPYIYLPVAAALRTTSRSLDEAALVAGRGPWASFRAVTLPLVAPAIAAGGLLVALYVVADFGSVAMLRYRTFTTAIYSQFAGGLDRAAAAALSFLLIGLTVVLLGGESLFSRRGHQLTTPRGWRPRQPHALGRWRFLATAYVAFVAFVALGLPLLVLGGLTLYGLLAPTELDRIWGAGNRALWVHGLRSFGVALAAATLATVFACAPASLVVRHPGRAARFLLGLSKISAALPGLIVGLALVALFVRWVPAIYGTAATLVLGFALRLLPQGVMTAEAALRGVPRGLEGAARTMGCGAGGAFRRVTMPLAAPGLLASWTLAFIAGMKELPAALLLRPPGFETLPVRVYAAASESVYTQAAPPATLLIALTVLPLAFLYSRNRFGLNRIAGE